MVLVAVLAAREFVIKAEGRISLMENTASICHEVLGFVGQGVFCLVMLQSNGGLTRSRLAKRLPRGERG